MLWEGSLPSKFATITRYQLAAGPGFDIFDVNVATEGTLFEFSLLIIFVLKIFVEFDSIFFVVQ